VRGKRVIILGGGDTGSDCLGTAIRQGAREVTQIELMPKPPGARADSNPWPAWPLVFRTSSSQQEGGAREFAFRTTRIEGVDGKVTALVGERIDPAGSAAGDVRFEVDQVILALGFVGAVAGSLVDQLGVTLDARGTIAVDRDKRTNVPRVYAAGDAHLGASLVVWAIAEGRDVAKAVDADLARAAITTAS